MENEKLLTQELILIDQLLELVNTKEEYDDLVAQAKAICPWWVQPFYRKALGSYYPYLCVKGGAAKDCNNMEVVTIKGVPVIDIYESFGGSYWYITEKCHKQDSIINGQVYEDDQILFGYVKLAAHPEFAEFGYISQKQLELQSPMVWKVRKQDWAVCPGVEVTCADNTGTQDGWVNPQASHAQPLLKGGIIKMEEQTKEQVDQYIELLNSITEKTGDVDSAAVIFQEILRDKRYLKRAEKKVINQDAEPTENQIQYLKKLGAVIPEGINRQKASDLISEAEKMRAQIRKALKNPIKI